MDAVAGLDATRPGQRRVLHAGCGTESLPDWLPALAETRLDLNPACEPDVVADLTHLGEIGPFDTVYCSHALEHLDSAGVAQALAEFHRVLTPGGQVLVFVPDLQDVVPDEKVLFVSPAGPVTGWDLYYGHALQSDVPGMAHRTGFVAASLHDTLERAGFVDVTTRQLPCHNLMAVGSKK